MLNKEMAIVRTIKDTVIPHDRKTESKITMEVGVSYSTNTVYLFFGTDPGYQSQDITVLIKREREESQLWTSGIMANTTKNNVILEADDEAFIIEILKQGLKVQAHEQPEFYKSLFIDRLFITRKS